MSTASLPSYTPPDFSSIPSYTAEPQGHERRLAQAPRPPYRQRAAADFVKHSKSGGLSLRLSEQMDGAVVPAYGARSPIEGVVELAKADGLAYVAVKVRRGCTASFEADLTPRVLLQVEGILKLKEVAAGGTTTAVLCNETVYLWRKGVDGGPCPCRLAFSVTLPSSFADEKGTYVRVVVLRCCCDPRTRMT